MVLHAAPSPEALMLNPGNKFRALKGNRKGQFATSINKQWCVCFERHDGKVAVMMLDTLVPTSNFKGLQQSNAISPFLMAIFG